MAIDLDFIPDKVWEQESAVATTEKPKTTEEPKAKNKEKAPGPFKKFGRKT